MREIKVKVILVRVSGKFEESTVPPQPLSAVVALRAKICRRGGNHMHDMQGVDPDRLPSYYIERNG